LSCLSGRGRDRPCLSYIQLLLIKFLDADSATPLQAMKTVEKKGLQTMAKDIGLDLYSLPYSDVRPERQEWLASQPKNPPQVHLTLPTCSHAHNRQFCNACVMTCSHVRHTHSCCGDGTVKSWRWHCKNVCESTEAAEAVLCEVSSDAGWLKQPAR